MEVALKKTGNPAERANPLMVLLQAMLHALIWVNWCFTMTKTDRFKAGIDTSGEGREN